MKTGDAALTLWVESKAGRHWVLEVTSRRRGSIGSKLWEVPVYDWQVERWGDDERRGALLRTPTKTAKTFNEAMRLARRTADKLERRLMKRSRR